MKLKEMESNIYSIVLGYLYRKTIYCTRKRIESFPYICNLRIGFPYSVYYYDTDFCFKETISDFIHICQ